MRALPLLALALALAAPSARADERAPAPREWHLAYYMAYDNNLEGAGRPILDMLKRGLSGEDVVVTCQADFRAQDGMKRYVLTSAGETVEAVEGEGSAEAASLRDYLDWVKTKHPARRYAVIFLDHGGKLGELSVDELPAKLPPGTDPKKAKVRPRWLEVVETAGVLSTWRKKLPAGQQVELMFLQQCGKGALENYHAFRESAKVLMGSQTIVGAPNAYYTEVVQALCAKPAVDGEALAAAIRDAETPNMFTTYTTVRGAAMADLPAKLAPVLAPLMAKEKLEAGRYDLKTFAAAAQGRPAPAALATAEGAIPTCFDQPGDEPFFDGLALLEALYAANGLDRAPLEAFATWAKGTMIAGHRVSPRHTEVAGSWCGFSIMVPISREAITRYAHYPIYRETQLDELLGKHLTALEARVAARRAALEKQREEMKRKREQERREREGGTKPEDAPAPDGK
jgi:hypothetical protein